MPVQWPRDAHGQPSEACERNLRGRSRPSRDGVARSSDGPDRIYVASDGKVDYVYLRRLAKGQPLDRGLDEALSDAIENLPIRR